MSKADEIKQKAEIIKKRADRILESESTLISQKQRSRAKLVRERQNGKLEALGELNRD